jgi:hypothetical protein
VPNAALVALLCLVGASTSLAQGGVRGVVRSDASGAPIPGARVELQDGGGVTRAAADGQGTYDLRGLSAGAHRMAVTAAGYDSLVVDVLLPADGALRLDLALTPRPAPLAPVRVVARSGAPRHAPAWPGAESADWQVGGDALRRSPALAEADAFRLLATSPQAQMLPEGQSAVHVRGGSADQNRFLLDGAPVYGPIHAGPAPSAFSPDIVDALVLHGGAPPARYGGALSSVVDVRTPAGVPNVTTVRGAFEPTSLRGAVLAPLVADRVALLVSARHSYTGLRREVETETRMPGSWWDDFAKLTVRAGRDEVTLSSFASENGLGFPASAQVDPDDPSQGLRRNLFGWSTATHALAWRRPLGARGGVETRLWSGRLDVGAAWRPDGDSLALQSRLQHAGLASVVTRASPLGTFVGGVELERLRARYVVTGPDDAPLLRRLAAPVVGSLFVDDTWRAGDAWTMRAGVRETWTTRAGPRLEPRLSATLRPSARLELSAGYARMHQYVQSLRNEESLLGLLVAPDLFVASDGASVPVAASDELAAAAALAIDPHTRVRVDGYARRMRGLVLVAPSTSEPFATDGFDVGRGEAWGVAVSAERRVERLSVQAGYALGTVTRRADGTRYHPAFAPEQSASLAVGARLGARTTVRSALWAALGRRTTLLGDALGWDARDPFSGTQELSGTPAHAAGPLDAAALPGFLRVDVGVRRTLAVWRGRGTLTGRVSVNDVLGRENVVGYVLAPGTETLRGLGMLPPSLLLGLDWGY